MVLRLWMVFGLLSICSIGYSRIHQLNSKGNLQQLLSFCVPFDTIFINEGTYQSNNFIIDKPLTIIGKNYPIIDGGYKVELVSIKADHVTIEGIKFINSGKDIMKEPAAIKLYNVGFANISNNIFENNYIGIYLQHSRNCKIKNNKVVGYTGSELTIGNGIHVWKCDSIQIINNNFSKHRDGIYFEFVTNSIIWRNISHHNVRYGLHFMFSHADAYIGNTFKSNGAGVAVMYTKHVTMLNNVFKDNIGDVSYGLLLKDITDSYVGGNHFVNNTSAIFADGISRIHFQKNVVKKNGWGIKLQASSNENIFEINQFESNTFDVSTNGSLVSNTFRKNYWDKYEGYDLDKNGVGDVPYHPLTLFSTLTESNSGSLVFFRSFVIYLLDKSEKLIPSITPEAFVDNTPVMKPYKYDIDF